MWIKSPSIAFALLAARLLACGTETGASTAASPDPVVPAITNAAGFFGLSPQEANRSYPLRLEGVVTLLDSQRNLLVVQDGSGALALEFPLTNITVRAGDRVIVTGASGIPSARAFPEFPCHPHEHELRDSFASHFPGRQRYRPPANKSRSTECFAVTLLIGFYVDHYEKRPDAH